MGKQWKQWLPLFFWASIEALVPSRDSRARTRSPSPRAWRPDFPGAAREAPCPRGPATSTGSLASQRHPGKFPKVPGRRRPLSMGFSRQEYWSGLPFPSPGDLPNPGIEPRSPTLQADCLPSEFTFHFHALEKEMATHSSVLAWRIPRTGEPGGLPFMGSTVSLTSQRHPEKLPEVTGTSQGNPGFPAATLERHRESFFNA